MENYRYFIFLAYNGSGFHGWQLQPNARTVQENLQNALHILTGKRILLTGAGRTDTGVHARRFYAHFDADTLMKGEELNQLVYKLNRFLSDAIVIFDIFRVKPDVHARFSAISRTYKYYISRKKDPFSCNQSWIYAPDLDFGMMNKAASFITEYRDFTCFSKSNTQTITNDCTIFESYFISDDDVLVYHVKANRFLRNMVRAIVGTMIDVGKGNISLERLHEILENGTRSDAGMSVPACGLFLENIEYPEDIRV